MSASDEGIPGRLHTCEAVSARGFSMLGDKQLTFTAAPSVHLHDTGGLLGDETTFTLEGDALADAASLIWTDRSLSLEGTISFGEGRKVGFVLTGGSARLVAQATFGDVLERDAEAAFDYPIPVSVLGWLADGVAPGDGPSAGSGGDDADDPAVWRTKLESNSLSARVIVDGGRFVLRSPRGRMLADVPGRHLRCEADEEKPDVRVTGGMLVADREVEGLTICFPTRDVAERFLMAVTDGWRSEDGEDRVLTDVVTVSGIGPEGAVLEETLVDASLGESSLTLRDRETGRTLLTVELEDAGTAIEGRREDFLVYCGRGGPLRVRPRSGRFRDLLGADPAVNAAAARASRHGPHLGLLEDGTPVRVSVDDEAVAFEGPCAPSAVPVGELIDLDVTHDEEDVRLGIRTESGRIEIRAQAGTIESIAARIREGMLLASGRDGLVERLADLARIEEDWLLYVTVGPVYQIHGDLRRALSSGADELSGNELRSPEKPGEELEFLSALALGLERLHERIDTILGHLPGYLLARDDELMGRTGIDVPDRPAVAETDYVDALAPLATIRSRVTRIEREVLRHKEVRTAVATATRVTKLTVAKIGLGIAYATPLALIGAAGGIAKDLSGARDRKKAADQTQRESALIGVRDWNFLVRVVVPPLARRIVQRLGVLREPVRACLSGRLTRARGKARRLAHGAVAGRLGRLLNLPLFADEPGGRPRAEAIEEIREALRSAPPAPFPPL
jgi:hypothetical protein